MKCHQIDRNLLIFFSPRSPYSPGKSTSKVVGNPRCQSRFNEPSIFAARNSIGILDYISMWELRANSLTESQKLHFMYQIFISKMSLYNY